MVQPYSQSMHILEGKYFPVFIQIPLKLVTSELSLVQVMTWRRYDIRAITWTTVDEIRLCYMASEGHNDIKLG